MDHLKATQEARVGAWARVPIIDDHIICSKKPPTNRRASLSSVRELAPVKITTEREQPRNSYTSDAYPVATCDRVPSWSIDKILSPLKEPILQRTQTVPKSQISIGTDNHAASPMHSGALQSLPSIENTVKDNLQSYLPENSVLASESFLSHPNAFCRETSSPVPSKDSINSSISQNVQVQESECMKVESPSSLESHFSTPNPSCAPIHSNSNLHSCIQSQSNSKQSSASLKRPYPSDSEDKYPSIISVDRREDANGRIVLKLKFPSLYYSSQTNSSEENLLKRSQSNSGLHRKKKRRKHRKHTHRFDEDISEHGMSLRKQNPTLTYTDRQMVTDDRDDRNLKWSLRSNISQVSRFSEEYIDVSLYKRKFPRKHASIKRTRHSRALLENDLDKLIEMHGVTPIYVHTKVNNSVIEEVVCEEYGSQEKTMEPVKVEEEVVADLPSRESSRHSKKRKKKRKRKKLKRKIEAVTKTVLHEKASESSLVTETLVNTQCSLPKKQADEVTLPENIVSEDTEQQSEENFPLLLASLRAPTEYAINAVPESDSTQEMAKEIIMGNQTLINEVTIEKISSSRVPEESNSAKVKNTLAGIPIPIHEPIDLKQRVENQVTIEKVSDRQQSLPSNTDKFSGLSITPLQSKPVSAIPDTPNVDNKSAGEEVNSDRPKKETLLSVLLQQNNKSTPSITFQQVTSKQSSLPYRERTPPLHDRLSHMPSERGILINKHFQQKRTPPTVRVAPVMKPREQPKVNVTSSQPSPCHLLKQYLSTGPNKKESDCEVVYSSGSEELVSRLNNAPTPQPNDVMRNSLMMFPHPAETNAAFMRYFTEINRYHMEWLEWVHKSMPESQSSHSYSEPVIYNPFRYPIGKPEVPTLQPEVPVTNWKIRIPPKEKPSNSEATPERAVPPLIPLKKTASSSHS